MPASFGMGSESLASFGGLGSTLLYVGIVLIVNGFSRLTGIDPRAQAIMNILAGGVGIWNNMVGLVLGAWGSVSGDITGAFTGNFYGCAIGLMFAFTYLFVAFNNLMRITDGRPFGWFQGFVAINAVIFGALSWAVDGDWVYAIIYWLWGILWFTGWIELVAKKNLGKFVGVLSVFEGIFTAWIPGFMMIRGVWRFCW